MFNDVFLTNTGKVRVVNEDKVLVTTNVYGQKLLIVADGMGGHLGGDVASRIIVETISKKFITAVELDNVDKTKEWFREVAREVNTMIFEQSISVEELRGMGSTLVLAIVAPEFTVVGNVGDSRCYVYTNKKLLQVTKDHSLINAMVDNGEITEFEAKYHPHKNIVMQAIGTSHEFVLDLYELNNTYEYIMLCSDGLTDLVPDSTIEKIIATTLDLNDMGHNLINAALDAGGTDNVSVALVRMDK